MSQLHEPEPWRIELNHPPLEYVLLKDTIVIGTADGDYGVCLVGKRNPANAERIVACVNALAGWKQPEAAGEVLAACEAQHKAIDWLLARLIELDRGFMPTKSPVWPMLLQGNAAIAKARGKA